MIQVKKNYQIISKILILIFLLPLFGCAQLGPDFMASGRNEYNKVLANTNDQETLLNLVRRRYADNVAILEVNSVSTSLVWEKSAGITSSFLNGDSGDSNTISIRGDGSYSEKPTITYLPLHGADYVKNVLSPVKLDMILLLVRSGWTLDRLLRLTVNKINEVNNASEASGPTPDLAPDYKKFKLISKQFSALHRQNVISFGYRLEGDNRQLGLLIKPQFRNTSEVTTFLKDINVDSSNTIIPITTNYSVTKSNTQIEMSLRSLAGIQFFLSHGVLIPEEDLSAGRVKITKTESGDNFDWQNILSDLFVVYSQKEEPKNAVIAVEYRGHWFYIKDNDMQTKYTMILLNQISALQSGKIEKAGPVLTLPVSQ